MNATQIMTAVRAFDYFLKMVIFSYTYRTPDYEQGKKPKRKQPYPGGKITAGNDATNNQSCISSCLS